MNNPLDAVGTTSGKLSLSDNSPVIPNDSRFLQAQEQIHNQARTVAVLHQRIGELEKSVAFWKRDAIEAITVIRALQRALDETISAILENRRPSLVNVQSALKLAGEYESRE
jgi:hypothetical protein